MMSESRYDPAKHHRGSIRLKGHDYAGGGLYFVTICAHRSAGNIFADPAVKAMVAEEWESVGDGLVSSQEGRHEACKNNQGRHEACKNNQGRHEACKNNQNRHKACPYVIMADHFHGLIEVPKGNKALGDLICEFKSRVVHRYIEQVKKGNWPRFPGKIWHRNYYEEIVRSAEAAERIAGYIRMNPWKCVQ